MWHTCNKKDTRKLGLIHVPTKRDHCITTWELSEAVCNGKPEVTHTHTQDSVTPKLCAVGAKDADRRTQSSLEVQLNGTVQTV
jgi:hypothetical protein